MGKVHFFVILLGLLAWEIGLLFCGIEEELFYGAFAPYGWFLGVTTLLTGAGAVRQYRVLRNLVK